MMLHCAQCGDPLTPGYWNIPTPRGLISLCTRCKAAPRLPEGCEVDWREIVRRLEEKRKEDER